MFPTQTSPQWEIHWNFDRPDLTYRIGETIHLTCTFKNTGQSAIHLRKICVWFDWMPEDEWYYIDSNAVYQPRQWIWPVSNIQIQLPLDVPPNHHGFRIGVEYRYWDGAQWVETGGVHWTHPLAPSLDQVLVNYPPQRNFKVFVSHSERDSTLSQTVVDYIVRCGQAPYVAESPQNPELGKKLWEEKIDAALQTSNVVLVLWTPNSASSAAVAYEIHRARQLGKRIIPAIQSPLEPPQELRGLVYVRFDFANQVEAIKAILTSLLDYEKEVNAQQGAGVLNFLALLAILGVAGAALSSRK